MSNTEKQQRVTHIDTAITRAGGIRKFCGIHGVTHQAVYAWKRRGAVPLDRALEIERRHGVPALFIVDPKMANAARMMLAAHRA